MNTISIIILIIVAIAFAVAAYFTIRNRKKHGCSSCYGCSQNCEGCPLKKQ